MTRLSLLVCVLVVVAGCDREGTTPYDWQLDAGIPVPPVPDRNPMTPEKVELGRHLFYDMRLSINGSTSCASCHEQARAFTDGRPRSVGATGEIHPRGAMSLINTAYAARFNWANPLVATIEDQMLTPLFGSNPVEMGLGGREQELLDMLQNDPRYSQLFAAAFPGQEQPVSTINLVRAIGSFVRSIVSFRSPYDRYLAGEIDAISDEAKLGERLFFDERFECFHCHGGFNFTDSSTHRDARVERFGFHNTGLYNIGNTGAYPDDNPGLADHTGERRDIGRFKAPTLRNVEVTAPYMHDGSIQTLEEVLAHYARGGRKLEEGPHAGDGRVSPFKSEFVRGFDASDEEIDALIAFLRSLTDEAALTDSRWGPPTNLSSAQSSPESEIALRATATRP